MGFLIYRRMRPDAVPAQEGGPPILIGGGDPNVLKRVAEYDDGWMPIDNAPLETIANRARLLQDEAQQRGRADRIPVTIVGEKSTPEHVANAMELGFGRVVFAIQSDQPDAVVRELDRLVKVSEQVLGMG